MPRKKKPDSAVIFNVPKDSHLAELLLSGREQRSQIEQQIETAGPPWSLLPPDRPAFCSTCLQEVEIEIQQNYDLSIALCSQCKGALGELDSTPSRRPGPSQNKQEWCRACRKEVTIEISVGG